MRKSRDSYGSILPSSFAIPGCGCTSIPSLLSHTLAVSCRRLHRVGQPAERRVQLIIDAEQLALEHLQLLQRPSCQRRPLYALGQSARSQTHILKHGDEAP
jgi:hypothetical protein